MTGRFALQLHSHIPYVLRHGRWPHGTDWICEAVAESYLPILATLRRLERDRVPARLTISFSPILTEQLADDGFRTEFDRWIQARREQLRGDLNRFERAGDEALANAARHWMQWIEETESQYHEIGGRLLQSYRELWERGCIELASCAATHGYLPLLSSDASVELQIRTALDVHGRHFGNRPKGFWLPECAYRPRYEWVAPTGRDAGRKRSMRPGLEEVLASHGIEYFYVDAHLALAGDPLSIYRNFYPSLTRLRGFEERFPQNPKSRNPYAAYEVKGRGAASSAIAYIREPRTALQVWNHDEGYPGDAAYLDFHRRDIANGPRYHRVTGAGVPLSEKEPYDPSAALVRTEENARHFVWLLTDILTKARDAGAESPIVCAPFDTELFGHWWFEGPRFLEHVFRHLQGTGVRAVTGSEGLTQGNPRTHISLLEGSWGEGGDHRAWLNKHTDWTWDRLYDAEDDLTEALGLWRRARAADGFSGNAPVAERALRQAMRELLLLQSSDWQFLITTQAAADYAERRFALHYVDLKQLLDLARRMIANPTADEIDMQYLRNLEVRDAVFRNIEPAWFSPSRVDGGA